MDNFGAKFQEHCFNISRDIVYSALIYMLIYINCSNMEGTCVLVRKQTIFSRYLGKFVVNVALAHYSLRQEK